MSKSGFGTLVGPKPRESVFDFSKLHRKSLLDSNLNRSNTTYKRNLRQYSKKTLPYISISSQRNSTVSIQKTKLCKKYPFLQTDYQKTSFEDMKYLYQKFEKHLLIIDIFSFLADLTVVVWLYFNHFQYNKHGYQMTAGDNAQRVVCLMISCLVCVLLIYSYDIRRRYQNVKFLLSLRASIPKQKFKIWHLLIEITIHLLQPYPGADVKFTTTVLGVDVTYTLDMILFTLSLARFYVIFKILKLWNFFTNGRGQRILKLYGNRHTFEFLYRANLKSYGFFTVSIVFVVCCFVGSYIFKVFENYQENESSSIFGNFWNSLWYSIQTMTTIGYGDFYPSTVVGRLISFLLCFAGIFLQSLLTVSLLLFIVMVSENEQKSFAEINVLLVKEKRNNSYNIFFNSFIKIKMRRAIRSRYNKMGIAEEINMLNAMSVIKEKHYLRVISSLKIPTTINDFCKFVREQWEPQAEDTIEWYKERNDTLQKFIEFNYNTISSFHKDIYTYKTINVQLANLFLFMYLCGPIFPIDTLRNLKGDCVADVKNFEVSLREFHVLYYYRRNDFTGKREMYFSKQKEGTDNQKEGPCSCNANFKAESNGIDYQDGEDDEVSDYEDGEGEEGEEEEDFLENVRLNYSGFE